MIKRVFLIIFLSLFSVLKTEAFLGEDLGLNLYKEIDKGYYKLQTVQLEYELKGEEKNITKKLNNFLKNNGYKGCIKEINQNQLEKIISGNSKILYEIIYEECKDKNGGINNKMIIKYLSLLKTFYNNSKINSKSKSKNIYEISRLGLYTDGNTENSPFDIISDLQEIDKIIFGEELEYKGEDNTDFLREFENNPFYKKLNKNTKSNKNNNLQNNTTNNLNENNTTNNLNKNNNLQNNNVNYILNSSNYNCIQDNTQSGLNPNDLIDIQNEFDNNYNQLKSGHLKLPDTNQINIPNIGSGIVAKGNLILTNIKAGNYESVSDNSQWRCSPESFFCITVDFIIHNQKLLGYGKEKSIKNLLEVSNNHLKKAANTSLLQARMGTNNFQNILRDLNFSEMFHMGFIITKKSPPFLDLKTKKEREKEKNKTKYQQILETLYKNQGLEYKRKNDLNLITQKEIKLKELINSTGNSPVLINKKEREKNLFLSNIKAENEYLTTYKINIINKGILQDFYKELVEYEKFIGGLYEYTEVMFGNIKKLYNKPRGD